MNSAIRSLGFVILWMVMYGCVKPLKPLPDTTFKIYNKFTMPLNIDVYITRTDYNNNTNVYFSGQVGAYDSLSMKAIRPDSNTTYYYDIYSSDYTSTNWGTPNITFTTIGNVARSFTIPGYNSSQFRHVFLNGNNTSTTWSAVNRYDNSDNPIWTTLSATQKFKTLVFDKSLSGTLSQKDDSANIITDSIVSITNFVNTAGLCALTLNITSPYPVSYWIYNTSYPPVDNNYHATKDTILLNDVLGYWVMVRQ